MLAERCVGCRKKLSSIGYTKIGEAGVWCDKCYYDFVAIVGGLRGANYWLCPTPSCRRKLLILWPSKRKCNLYYEIRMFSRDWKFVPEQVHNMERDSTVSEWGHCSYCGQLVHIDKMFEAAQRFMEV